MPHLSAGHEMPHLSARSASRRLSENTVFDHPEFFNEPQILLEWSLHVFRSIEHNIYCKRIYTLLIPGYVPNQNFENMTSPGKITITARTASKFCARNRSQSPDIFDPDLISWVIPGPIEPWSECKYLYLESCHVFAKVPLPK